MEVVIETMVGGVLSVTGTSEPVTGLSDGSTVVACNGIDEKRVLVIRGFFQLPSIPGLGSFYTKFITDNFLTFTSPLVAGEYLYIKTIPV